MSIDFRKMSKYGYGLTEKEIQELEKYEAMETIGSDGRYDLKYEGYDENGNIIKTVWFRNDINIEELKEEDVDPYLTIIEKNKYGMWCPTSIRN